MWTGGSLVGNEGSIVIEGNEGSWEVQPGYIGEESNRSDAGTSTVLGIPDAPVEQGDAVGPAESGNANVNTAVSPTNKMMTYSDRIRSLTPQKDAAKIKRKQRELDDCTIEECMRGY